MIDWTDKDIKFAAVSSDAQGFAPNWREFNLKYDVLEYHISGTPVQMPNPSYKNPITQMIMPGQPEIIQTIIVTAVVFYKEKPKKKNDKPN